MRKALSDECGKSRSRKAKEARRELQESGILY